MDSVILAFQLGSSSPERLSDFPKATLLGPQPRSYSALHWATLLEFYFLPEECSGLDLGCPQRFMLKAWSPVQSWGSGAMLGSRGLRPPLWVSPSMAGGLLVGGTWLEEAGHRGMPWGVPHPCPLPTHPLPLLLPIPFPVRWPQQPSSPLPSTTMPGLTSGPEQGYSGRGLRPQNKSFPL